MDSVEAEDMTTSLALLSLTTTPTRGAKGAKSRSTLVNNRPNKKKLPDTFYPNKKGMIRQKNHLTLLSL